MSSNRTYHKTCLLCRKDFVAQKYTTMYCAHSCASKAHKLNRKNKQTIEVNYNEFMKRTLLIQGETLNQIQITLSELVKHIKQTSQEYINPNDYCTLKNISRKTLSRLIENKKVQVKRITDKKVLIKNS